ncbi:MAG: hypothetical protein FVQ81_10370 [Candidatus Glassbacteria bacterium]|nr:hypothetical protein [Candidatus Glassbacteria bacterium]
MFAAMNRKSMLTAALAALTFYAAGLEAELRILQPTGAETVYSGASLRMVARWSGDPAGLSFRWSSDVDGELGTGLVTSAEALSYASHRITIEAFSGDSLAGRARTVVHVIGSPEQFTLSERTDWEGEFSPSGRRLAYTSYRSGDPEIWVAEVENRFAERITYNGGRTPVWNPDGTRLAFWSERSGSRDIWLVDLAQDPREAVRLTKSSADEWMPAFHPLESKIAYIAKHDRELRLMVMTLGPMDTTAVEVVGPERYPMFPRWSSDGRELLFTSFAGSTPVLIRYSTESGALIETGPPGCEDADISPGGDRVLLVRDGELYLLSTGDGAIRPLSRDSGGVLSPRFSPDGNRAVYATTRSGNCDLWLLDLPPGR